MQTSEWIALVSASGAIAAAGFAWWAASQAKRQADAVLGDVPPLFGAYQLPDNGKDYRNRFSVEIVNHNRLPLFLYSLRLEYPSEAVVYRESKNTRDLLHALYDTIVTNKKIYSFDVPLRLSGRFSSELPAISTSIFNVGYAQGEDPFGFPIGITFKYKLDGEKHLRTAYASTQFDPIDPH